MSVQLPPPQALLTKASPETASLLGTVLLPPCLEAAPFLEHCLLISSSSLPRDHVCLPKEPSCL